MPQPHISRAVLGQVRVIPDYPNLTVLDLSCGDGEILTQLQAEGCRCRGTRYRPDDYILEHPAPPGTLQIDDQVDLLQPLPYDSASFDVVLLIEVLEHLERHDQILFEAARVLQPGGRLIFSTPNIQRLHSRWHFFLTGTHKLIRRPVGWDVPVDAWYSYHIRPVDFPTLHTQLYQAGFQIKQLVCTQWKLRHAPWLAIYPWLWLAAHWEFRTRHNMPSVQQRGRQDLRHWMVHPAMLASEQLLVLAQKCPPSQNTRPSPNPHSFPSQIP